jgi:CRISPR-associated protein Cmr1
MKKLEYQVQFTTPAFLGNAEQDGQWRTPPFKALLRQWWRVAYAAGRHEDRNLVAEMRRHEGELFGVAADDAAGSRKSLIRIRLNRWDLGKETKQRWGQQDLGPGAKVEHREVPQPIGPLLYLGYGPLAPVEVRKPGARRPEYATVLKHNAAVQAKESAQLSLAFPDAHAAWIVSALGLMHHYGTIGGRSRNGWGSFTLIPATGQPPALDTALDQRLSRPWRHALALDWPHAIGRDDRGLLAWQTSEAFDDWRAVMRRLAEIKIGLRTQFAFTTGRNAPGPEQRHWLSYPVTKHNVADWRERGRGDLRLPNSLRFKIRPDPDGRLRGVIFHVPCLPPQQFHPDLHIIEGVWQRVHAFLDAPAQQISRIPQ